MQQAGFLPKGAFRRDNARNECSVGHKFRKKFRDVGLNGFLFMRPVIRTSTQFDLHDRANITGGFRREHRRIMEQQTLAIGHIGVNFQFPSRFTER